MKVCVLFNPRAGSAGQIEALRAALAADPAVTLRELGPDDDLPAAAARAARGGFDVVAVAGGDGSVHAAVNGLMEARGRAALAVLPLGTGNDFCRTLGIPLDPVAAARLLRTGTPRAIDVVLVRGDATAFMANAATGGFSGQVSAGVTPELKGFWGPLAYLRGAVGSLASPPRFRLAVRFDGGPVEEFDALNVVVANGRTAAGGLPVAPTANPEDGRLDVVIIRAADTLDLSVVAARLMHGDYTHDENVTHRLARTVEIASDPPLPLSIDGELTEGSRFTFAVVPGAVRVLAGPDYDPAPAREPAVEDDDAPEATPAAAAREAAKGARHRLFGFLAGGLLLAKRTPRASVAALAVVAVAVLTFAWLANGVRGGAWREWNEMVRAANSPTAYPELRPVALGLTWLGGVGAFVVSAAVLAFFLWRKQYLNAATFVGLLVGLGAMDVGLKPIFGVARPPLYDDSPPVRSLSFPSGHALRGVGIFGFLAALTVIHAARRGKPAWLLAAVACAVTAVGVCWSRIYLGVHWPTDVIAGGLAASAWVAACLTARHYAMSRPGLPG